MALSIKLFGGLAVTDESGHLFRLPTRKSEALFAYLVEHRNQSLSRETLADLLWPYSGPDQARASLRQEVSVLRKALGPANADSIVSHGDRIEFSQDEANVDLWNFIEIGVGGQSVTKQIELLSLYTAPFFGHVSNTQSALFRLDLGNTPGPRSGCPEIWGCRNASMVR